MFRTLFAITSNPAAFDRAVTLASRLARHRGPPLELLTVVARRADDRLAVRSASAPIADVARVTVLGTDGDVADAIIEHIANQEGVLLVMSTSATGLVSLERRSVTARLLERLTEPVLLVGPAVPDNVDLDGATLIVGIDRSLDAQPALPVVESWHQAFGGPQPLLVDILPISGWPPGTIEEADQRSAVDAVVDTFATRGIAADGVVVHGNEPVQLLLDFATTLRNPVFVTTSERWAGAPSHWYSTTRRLLQRSPRPVLVVPRDYPA
jgi:nucleotide-binding universal stress UspA family protein